MLSLLKDELLATRRGIMYLRTGEVDAADAVDLLLMHAASADNYVRAHDRRYEKDVHPDRLKDLRAVLDIDGTVLPDVRILRDDVAHIGARADRLYQAGPRSAATRVGFWRMARSRTHHN